jgi:hypothetical protein
MRRILRELRREFPFARIEVTNGGHYRLHLPNGRTVVVASTPSSRFFLHRARADVRKRMESKGDRA